MGFWYQIAVHLPIIWLVSFASNLIFATPFAVRWRCVPAACNAFFCLLLGVTTALGYTPKAAILMILPSILICIGHIIIWLTDDK